MKKVFLAAAVMATLVSGRALASDTLTIDGEMIESGCIVGNNGNADINLDKITVDQLKAAAIGGNLAEKASSFNIHDCPAYDIALSFSADVPPGFPQAIVNDLQPSGDVVAHYMRDDYYGDHMTIVGRLRFFGDYYDDARAQMQTPEGYDYPVSVGYKKIAEVQPGVSPAGLTHSSVTVNITYMQ
ncbi:hypothetical protein [Citrobacter sp. U14242]|uniref:hypothetical protein n=1 Tax=Citrobacter sp. U14242 TaxID=3390192 RepID=UPI00397D121B